jgi:ribonucleoside-diphosphate reductase alpha chain
LLGSFNLVKYVKLEDTYTEDTYRAPDISKEWKFDYDQFREDIPAVVRAMDNVVDRAIYPLPQQEQEAKNKRRMGLGVTGVANAIECLGAPYGSKEFLRHLSEIMTVLRDTAYKASIDLAKEKGKFPAYDDRWLDSEFAHTLPDSIRRDILTSGIRNSHLLSVAPTGTISLSADNVSSGIEPVFSYSYTRDIITYDGPVKELVEDYGVRVFGIRGRTSDQCSVFDHVRVLNLASQYVDSACSKTCNVGADVTCDEFKDVYMQAYEGGDSGCTTFRASGKRAGILNAASSEDVAVVPETEPETFIEEGAACFYDPTTGMRSCE